MRSLRVVAFAAHGVLSPIAVDKIVVFEWQDAGVADCLGMIALLGYPDVMLTVAAALEVRTDL